MTTLLKLARHRRRVFAAAALSLIPRLLFAAPDLQLEMSVDVPVPAPGQPVQFTVTLRNVGPDPATAVVVTDKLPAGLDIPSGMAAFASTGSYDPVTGAWTVGDLGPAASAQLVIPAIVTATTQPPCLANVAETSNSLDSNAANNRAVAAVRGSAADRCVDVSVDGRVSLVPPCQTSRRLDVSVVVANAGPDIATNVLVDLSQSPVLAPNLRFTGAGCSGLRCTVASLAPGASVTLPARSDTFQNRNAQTLTLNFSASSAETDFSTINNQLRIAFPVPDFRDCADDFSGATVTCFIATAAYGSPLEPHVVALRQFRDRYLQHTALGRAFIRYYYRYSPPLAAIIAERPALRSATRAVLTPLVLAIVHPLWASLLLATAFAVGWRLRRRPGGQAAGAGQ
jgi:uncharacterized repeat protein (TIGR01451 family)